MTVSKPGVVFRVSVYSIVPLAACAIVGLSLPDHPLSFMLLFSLFFAWSEFGLSAINAKTAGAPGIAHETGSRYGIRSDIDKNIVPEKSLARLPIFPVFALTIAMCGGNDRIETVQYCLLAVLLVLLADSIGKVRLSARLRGFMPASVAHGFAGSLATVILVVGSSYIAIIFPPAIACAGCTTILIVLLAAQSRRKDRKSDSEVIREDSDDGNGNSGGAVSRQGMKN